MATHEQRTQALDLAISKLKELSQVDSSSLARTTDLSPDINFKDAVPHFEEMLDLCKQLSQRDLSRLPYSQLTKIASACDQLKNLIAQVEGFTLNQNTPGDVCKNIVNTVVNAYDVVMDPLLLPLAFTATQATDYAKIEREAKGYHATMKSEADNLTRFLTSARTDAEKALAAVQDQAAEAGVATNAQIFADDAKQHAGTARLWLKATVVMGAVTLLVAVVALVVALLYHPEDTGAAIQYVVAKLIVLSVLSFGVIWCARNFKSQKHNETLNRHRANALRTFRAFVEGTSDIRVKDAILIHAAQAAFSSRSTGFDDVDRDASLVSPVVEILGRGGPQSTDGQ